MEMPELNEDLLEGESTNPDDVPPAEDSGSLDESALQPEEQTPMEIDPSQAKPEVDPENKPQEEQPQLLQQQHQQENEDTLDESDLQRPNEEIKEEESQGGILLGDPEVKQEDDEPAAKKIKLEEENQVSAAEAELEQQEPMKQQSEQQEGVEEPQPEPEAALPQPQEDAGGEPEPQTEGTDSQELMDIKKEEDEKAELAKEKPTAGPDTDMLATLASAALEQDPKDKAAAAPTPKSPVPKQEPEMPKKKPEQWCNVGVFDTNTTIVSDYLATPEPNEHVDLVTATLGGRRIQLEPGTAYKFRVCAVNGCGTGPWSDVAAFKTTLPGFPGAPSAIKISKSPEGAHLTWEPPGGNSSEILEYAVYLAVRSASQGCQPVTTNQAQLAFVRVFCGPTNKCMVGTNSLQAAHIDTTTKPAIIFRIAARNSKGYGPATQVRWLQESANGTTQGVKRAVKS